MQTAKVVLYVRVPPELSAQIEALVADGRHRWPPVTKQSVVHELLQRGLEARLQVASKRRSSRPARSWAAKIDKARKARKVRRG